MRVPIIGVSFVLFFNAEKYKHANANATTQQSVADLHTITTHKAGEHEGVLWSMGGGTYVPGNEQRDVQHN